MKGDGLTDRECLSIEGIVDFADSVDLEDLVSELINTNIIDITQEYKLATKDKTVIGAYRVELSIENFML